MKSVRVSIRPYVYQGTTGYKVRWFNGDKFVSLFTQTYAVANRIKVRIKEGKTATTPKLWAVQIN